ncbi:CGNR zinc finger domain-containing protein [Nocardia huaxiensis]|uniref:CGNR zinc finger domain-containing protein n=1 Tax=Nocardia huaxiensis TaxID=2755382 RepID=A0A7D6ZFL5_9NOCA|nr:ABATE domain-containing protein [Nocardia huaxiensis]QLY29147.1 CGNR zinc finger domain-containing protein [Nocardia huaxiensis]UFS97360.1 CGNR zinc finger domain-containing protein [Nocardia huaxiensis]
MFTFVSGNLVLDFIGTVKARRTDFTDLLETPADLGDWFVEAGLLDRAPTGDPDTLRQATALREAAWHLALAAIDGNPLPDADRRLINRLAQGPLPDLALQPDGSVRRTGTADQALSEIARTAIELFAGADSPRIKECGRQDCTRLYVDTSRAGSRRWCDMTVCGNRSKSAAFRARQA